MALLIAHNWKRGIFIIFFLLSFLFFFTQTINKNERLNNAESKQFFRLRLNDLIESYDTNCLQCRRREKYRNANELF